MSHEVDSVRNQLLEALETCSEPEKEIFFKSGRSRIVTFTAAGPQQPRLVHQTLNEHGYTARYGTPTSSATWSEVGVPSTILGAPRLGTGLQLPTKDLVSRLAARAPARNRPSLDLDRPLFSEGEASRLISTLMDHLASDLGRSLQVQGRLEDGVAQTILVNGHGVEEQWRTRTASLRVDVRMGGLHESAYVAAAQGQAIHPRSLAQRLVDKLSVEEKARRVAADRQVAVLAPEVIAALLGAIAPLFHRPIDLSTPLNEEVTVVDDGGLEGGVFAAPFDGEGVPTRRTELICRGHARDWLRAWDDGEGLQHSTGHQVPIVGCRRRVSWRDVPRKGTSHVVLEPSQRSPRALLEEMGSGYYLIGSSAVPGVDQSGYLILPVIGFQIASSALHSPIRARLRIAPHEVLARIRAVGRDLQFHVLGCAVGAPSILMDDVELVR